MDAFKGHEIARMQRGGNERWKRFWAEKSGRGWKNLPGELKAFEEVYGGDVGEEWRERLGCEVEGREFLGLPEKKKKEVVMRRRETVEEEEEKACEEVMMMTTTGRSQKEMNEDFFARKGGENERRREDLPPSQGGKYAGFGSSQPAAAITASGEEGMPGVDEFQKDPVAALTKGFGWFTTTVGKGAKSVNDGWVKPNVQKLAEADLATQARLTAAQVAQNIQAGSKNAAEHFNRFVEDSTSPPPYSSSHLTSRHPRSKTAAAEPEHKDFWDSFGSPVAGGAEDNNHTHPPAAAAAGSKPPPPQLARNNGMMMSGRDNSPVKQQQQQQQGRGSPAPSSAQTAKGGGGNAIGTAAMRKVVGKEKEEDRWDDF
ncbi:MAG: hypothetical protein Q9197_006469 [Variospora fuerteventurae]